VIVFEGDKDEIDIEIKFAFTLLKSQGNINQKEKVMFSSEEADLVLLKTFRTNTNAVCRFFSADNKMLE